MGLEYFTPITGLLGGGLIGFSAGLLLLFSGEILGSSGIASSVVLELKTHLTEPRVAWKLVFMATFLLFSNIFLAEYFTNDERLGSDPSIPVVSNWGYLLGGLFVGFGTRLSNGCTTGHGICGMARLSTRSIAAVCTFMLSAFAVSAVISPENKAFASGTAWLRTDTVPVFFNRWLGFGFSFIFVIPSCIALYNLFKKVQKKRAALIQLENQASIYFPKLQLAELTAQFEKEDTAHDSSKALLKDVANYGASESGKADTGEVDEFKSEDKRHVIADRASKAKDMDTSSSKSKSDAWDKDDEKRWEELKALYRVTSQRLADGKIVPAAVAACIFALGLAISQMVLPSKVLGFLALNTLAVGRYDPTLLTVMVGGAFISFLSYQFVNGWGLIKNPWARSAPISSSEFCVPTNKTIDWQLLFGAFCFGFGWAVAGLCPGPATFLAASGAKPVLAFWWPFYYVGAFLAQKLKDSTSKKF